MLTRLHVRGLAVLDEIELELGSGFSVLTGETGTGKSMLVDALALALGARAESAAVRKGATRAEITAAFDLGGTPSAAEWLRARDLDAGSECHLRRIVTPEGRSRGYVNGQQVPMEFLRELGAQLIEICGQHAHQSLLDRPMQRAILDAHGKHTRLVNAMGAAFQAWSTLLAERARLREGARDREARRTLIEYQLRELEALQLREGEVETLEQERTLLANVARISAGLGLLVDRLHDADGVSAHDVVGASLRELKALADLDPALGPAVDSLELAGIQLLDTVEQLRARQAGMEQDPRRLDAVHARLEAIGELARKHRTEPDALWSLAGDLRTELDALETGSARLDVLDAEAARLTAGLGAAADALHVARVAAARSLESAVRKNLDALGMPGSRFVIDVVQRPTEKAGPGGADDVEFRLSTSAGQDPAPIGKVASGGELSRLSLAIHVAAMTHHGALTLVFDEVDAGIGGAVAEMVGRSLRRLSTNRQVLCVTHLAQVASQADHHFAVSKTSHAGTTRTSVHELGPAARVEEIARMLGGVKITARSREHAREMLEVAGLPVARRAGTDRAG